MSSRLGCSKASQPQGRPKGRRHGEDRRSQGRPVIGRICPRRSGLEGQESMWNRLEPGKANDERRQSLGASRNSRPRERSLNGHRRVLPSCPIGLRCVFKMQRIYRAAGRSTTGMSLERLEPCEGKLSRTVLRGARAGDRFRTYPVHCCRDSTTKSLLSSLRPSGRGEAIFLACLDLGALEMCVLWHAFALRLP